MPDQAVTFDAPLQHATTINVPAAPAPTTAALTSTLPSGVTFDAPLSTATSVNIPAQQQQPQPPTAQVSATPDNGFANKLKNWANNVAGDIENGTDITGVGHVLKAMGAHGVYSGNSHGVGDVLASLPLGLLRSAKGGVELTQSGQRWQGTKDTVGGALQASTLPGGFVAPEAGELAGEGTDAALTQAGRAAKATKDAVKNAPSAVKDFVSSKASQTNLQSQLRTAIQQTAQEHGIPLPNSASIRDVTQTLSDAVRAKAHGIYQQLDNALGGTRFQAFDDKLANIEKALRESVGIDPNKDTALAKRFDDVTAARNDAMDSIRAQGLDPDDLIGKANGLHQRAMALTDLSKGVRASTDAHPSIATAGEPTPSNIKTAPFFKRVQQLSTPNPKYPGTPSRLVQALGEQRASELLNAVDEAHLYAQKVAVRHAWIKGIAKYAGVTGAGAAALHFAHDLLGASE